MERSASLRKSRPGRARWRSWLVLLGVIFASSAILRVGSLEFAWASGAEATASPPVAAFADSPPETARALQEAAVEIETLRRELDARAALLADRERALDAAQSLVAARLEELAAAETRLEALIATSDAAAEVDLDRLTRVYETMPPDTAAALFGQMPPSFAAGFIARMAPAASAALLAAMQPQEAYAVSVILATRNSSAPRLEGSETGVPDTER